MVGTDILTADGHDDPRWTDVEACTLPTAERPLRLAEFDDLFAISLGSIAGSDETHARLLLAGDEAQVDRTRKLADAESPCCSFFTFEVTRLEHGHVALDIAVPHAYADVLAGLVARAEAASGAAR